MPMPNAGCPKMGVAGAVVDWKVLYLPSQKIIVLTSILLAGPIDRIRDPPDEVMKGSPRF